MSKSLLEQLPEIVRAGKREAERILEGLEGRTRIGLQTRELVTPAKDTNWQEFQSLRSGVEWHYCLLGETLFYEFKHKGGTMEELLQFSRVRPKAVEKTSLFD
jgi:hypothetical protein